VDLFEAWHWAERVAGILLVVCLCLYLLRCVVAWDFISVERFGHFLRGLFIYLLS